MVQTLGLAVATPWRYPLSGKATRFLILVSVRVFGCFLAAAKVGKNGRVIGVDMISEMIEKVRENAKKGNLPGLMISG